MLFIALLYILLGVLIKYGKVHFLIAGYDIMPKEEKAKIDIARIATVFRNTMFGMAFILLVGYIASILLDNPSNANVVFFVSILVGLPYLLITSNSKKHKIDNN